MTPEEMENKILKLENEVRAMQNANTITPEFSKVLSRVVVTSNGKTAASETQAVDEAGSGTYNVAKPVDGFVTIGGYNIPYYNT